MLVYPIEISRTASSGTWSFNTNRFDSGAILRQVIIKAATTTTTFDFSLTDDKGNVVYDSALSGETATGTFNKNMDIPLSGIYTVAVSSSTADEAFTGRLMVLETN